MEFWKPGENAPGQRDKNSIKNADDYVESKLRKDQLDVCKYRQQILYLIEQFDLVLVIGETGTGKTSQIPLYIHEAGYAKQGRMVGVICRNSTSCVNHATKASDQMRTFISGKVGYSIPFDDNCSHATEIKYTCPQMFLQQVLIDPLLSEYSILLIDDVNERLFENDIVFAIIKKIMKKRSDLKVMLLSNSEDDEKLIDYFKSDKLKAISLKIESRCYPVQEYYLEKECADYITEALNTVLYIHQNETNGDILVFLNTVEEIESLSTILLDLNIVGLRIISVLGDGTVSQHLTGGSGARSIIICSIFIEFNLISNVKFVVDSGFQMLQIFNCMEGLTRSVKLPATSSVSAKRARLAGLNRPGKCFRLYSSKPMNDEEDVNQMVDLTWTVLILYALGVKNVLLFDFPRPPAVSRIAYALEVKSFLLRICTLLVQ